MNSSVVILIAVVYLTSLFLSAYFAEKWNKTTFNLSDNPYIYSLALAVYCSAWTFFGSVGRVEDNGIDFLSIYLGPTIVMILGWWIILKIKRISNYRRITSIADFIATRYDKSNAVGTLVTLVSVIAIVPYLALQIKAINSSFRLLTAAPAATADGGNHQLLLLVVILILFTIFFSSRNIQSDEKNVGMIFAIALESAFKLLAFLIIGAYITYVIFDGFGDLMRVNDRLVSPLNFSIFVKPGYGNFIMHALLAGGAFLFLPRQFQVTFVEVRNEKLLEKSIWLFPLYLLLINLFVIPIAIAGNSLAVASPVSSDMYVIAIPLFYQNQFMATLGFLGGFSAATGMIIMESMAIGKMITNNLIFPLVLRNVHFKENFRRTPLIYIRIFRRLSIMSIISLGYAYFLHFSEFYKLASIGLVAFVAVFQFFPALIGGIFWESANKKGAIAGMCTGIFFWFILLVYPDFKQVHILGNFDALTHITAAIQLPGYDVIANATFWTILANTFVFVLVSSLTQQSATEKRWAELFISIDHIDETTTPPFYPLNNVNLAELTRLFGNFVGIKQAERLLSRFLLRNQLATNTPEADSRVVDYVERLLGGVVGTVSAKIIVASVYKESPIAMSEVIEIIKESQSYINLNKELNRKQEELEKLARELRNSNDQLIKIDNLKNEFLTTVTHEIRTPLTSVKALSEILADNDDLDHEERQHFLATIIGEVERMSRLVNQVLDLERYESGKQTLSIETFDLADISNEIWATQHLANAQTGVAGEFVYDKNQDFSFVGDKDKIKQVILNLLANAWKFVPKENGEIKVVLEKLPRHYRLKVIDNGIGIPGEQQPFIFDKFYQANNQNLKKPKGSGLGLAISKQIVSLHGGEISVSSTPNVATVFTLLLPPSFATEQPNPAEADDGQRNAG